MDDDWGYPHDSGNHQIIYSYRLYDFSRFSVPFLPVFVAVLSMSGPPEGMTITGSRLGPGSGLRTPAFERGLRCLLNQRYSMFQLLALLGVPLASLTMFDVRKFV